MSTSQHISLSFLLLGSLSLHLALSSWSLLPQLLFFLFFMYSFTFVLPLRVDTAQHQEDKSTISLADYSLIISGFAKNRTAKEVYNSFSKMFFSLPPQISNFFLNRFNIRVHSVLLLYDAGEYCSIQEELSDLLIKVSIHYCCLFYT